MKKGRLVKGSPQAKAYMAKLRRLAAAKRKMGRGREAQLSYFKKSQAAGGHPMAGHRSLGFNPRARRNFPMPNPLTKAEYEEAIGDAHRDDMAASIAKKKEHQFRAEGRAAGRRATAERYYPGSLTRHERVPTPNPGPRQRAVAEAFAKGETHAVASNFYVHGNRIYSYGPHFPIAEWRGGQVVMTTRHSPSVTTSGHIGMVKRALAAAGIKPVMAELIGESSGKSRYLDPHDPRAYNNPRGRGDALDKQIEQAWYRLASGVQVSVMDIPKIFRYVREQVQSGQPLDGAITMAVSRFGRNSNPRARNNFPMPNGEEVPARVVKGIYYFPTFKIARDYAMKYGIPIGRIIAYQRGWAVQKEKSGAYWGPKGWSNNPSCNPACVNPRHPHGATRNPRYAGETRSFADLLERGRQRHGSQFDPSQLAKKFIPYYESGDRIEVKFRYGEVGRGRVGVTTGWRPVFILLKTTRSMGSSETLSDKDEIAKWVSKNPGGARRNSGQLPTYESGRKLGLFYGKTGKVLSYNDARELALDAALANKIWFGTEAQADDFGKGFATGYDEATRKGARRNPLLQMVSLAGMNPGKFQTRVGGKTYTNWICPTRSAAVGLVTLLQDHGGDTRLVEEGFMTTLPDSVVRKLGRESKTFPEKGFIEYNPRRNPRQIGVTEFSLLSTPMFYTPGILEWARQGFRTSSGAEQRKFVNVFVQGYKLTPQVAKGLLDGSIPYKVKGEAVVFTARMAARKNPSFRPSPSMRAPRRNSGIRVRRGVQINPVPMSNVKVPFKNGQKIPVEKARAWVRSTGDKELARQLEEAIKLGTKANKEPDSITWKLIPIGSKSRIDMVTAMAHYGDSPETYYVPPKGSKKDDRTLYRHKWGEGGKGKGSVPLLAAAGGKALLMPLEGKKVAGDWLRH